MFKDAFQVQSEQMSPSLTGILRPESLEIASTSNLESAHQLSIAVPIAPSLGDD